MSVSVGAIAVDELLLDMLRIPSPTGSEWRLAAWLRERLAALGFSADVDAAGNCVAGWGDGPVEVMLLGHLDTVPGAVPVARTGDRISGRGAVDAKGPLAAAIAAVAEQPRDAGVRYTVVGCADEEGDSRGARHLLAARAAPQHLVVLEPSGWDAITIGYRGVVRATLQVQATVHHRAAPISTAADRLVELLAALNADLNQRNAERSAFQRLDLRVTRLDTSTDGLGETAECALQFRLPVDVSADELMEWVDRRRGDAEFLVQFAVDAVRSPRDSRIARAFTAAIRAHGGTPRHKVKTGTADMNLLAPRWGVPAIAYGPGDSHLDHSPDEAIDIADLERGVRVIAEALRSLR
jgi:LysW-gamma-L-lysine carboxypeptidase